MATHPHDVYKAGLAAEAAYSAALRARAMDRWMTDSRKQDQDPVVGPTLRAKVAADKAWLALLANREHVVTEQTRECRDCATKVEAETEEPGPCECGSTEWIRSLDGLIDQAESERES